MVNDLFHPQVCHVYTATQHLPLPRFVPMKLLLTANGITNQSINNALTELLGKPIAESAALFIPTAIYPFPGGGNYAMQAIGGKLGGPFTQLGWKSLGLLELSILPGVEKEVWLQAIRETDALLFWGGDPIFLAYWLEASGLAKELPSLLNKTVYVSVSAGSMAVCSIIGETYTDLPKCTHQALSSEEILFGDVRRTFQTAHGAGLVDFAIIPHFDNVNHPDASVVNAEKWAKKIPAPVYAIDNNTAIKVHDKTIEVVSEGKWVLYNK